MRFQPNDAPYIGPKTEAQDTNYWRCFEHCYEAVRLAFPCATVDRIERALHGQWVRGITVSDWTYNTKGVLNGRN